MSDRRETLREQIARGLGRGAGGFQPLAYSEPEPEAVDGDVEPGDYAKTLNRTRAIYGEVMKVTRRGMVILRGRTQPGAYLETVSAHKESVQLLGKGNGAQMVERDA